MCNVLCVACGVLPITLHVRAAEARSVASPKHYYSLVRFCLVVRVYTGSPSVTRDWYDMFERFVKSFRLCVWLSLGQHFQEEVALYEDCCKVDGDVLQ